MHRLLLYNRTIDLRIGIELNREVPRDSHPYQLLLLLKILRSFFTFGVWLYKHRQTLTLISVLCTDGVPNSPMQKTLLRQVCFKCVSQQMEWKRRSPVLFCTN